MNYAKAEKSGLNHIKPNLVKEILLIFAFVLQNGYVEIVPVISF